MQKSQLMKLKIIILLICLIISIPISLTGINVIVLNNIYFNTNYELSLENSDNIVDKFETFEYYQFLKKYDRYGEAQDISKFNQSDYQSLYNYIDREYIDFLKNKINQDRKRFHWWPGHYHHFMYTFNATEQSRLYFAYSNTKIYNATYETKEELFVVDYDREYYDYAGNWYINFTYVPIVADEPIIIPLNDTILVKMFVEYDYLYGNMGGIFYQITQFIALSSDLQVIFIYVPLTAIIVA